MSKSKKTKTPKFEEAIEQVETIIEQIEAGQVDLEKCLAQYETGVQLVRRCELILKTAEKKMAQLSVGAGGKLTVKGDPDQ